MTERPILFSAPMVRAILDGSKTQTRRVVKPNHLEFFAQHPSDMLRSWGSRPLPYGQTGDRLWVREAFYREFDGPPSSEEERLEWVENGYLAYKATDNQPYGSGGFLPFRPSIHMPRWASRITLEITGARVQRLQDISEADAIAEGCAKNHNGYYWGGSHAVSGLKQLPTAIDAYRDLWQSINGSGSWEANPWVWVVEFKRVQPC